MALLNRFSKLNDRSETGVFTFIVTKSVTRDFHRDATTKDFCFGYHRWAISFQRPSEKQLGVHLLLRNPSPSTGCLVDFKLTLLNRLHFSQNKVHSKRRAKFTITNPMQGVSRWIEMAELSERHFANETGEFLFELSLSNLSTIFECDIQLSASLLAQYRANLANQKATASRQPPSSHQHPPTSSSKQQHHGTSGSGNGQNQDLISLETNYFTFGAFEWSLTIVPLVVHQPPQAGAVGSSDTGEPVCRVYLNRLTGLDSLCRVRYRVILGHKNEQHQQQQQRRPTSSTPTSQTGSNSNTHQPSACSSPSDCQANSESFVDSRTLDQISDSQGRIRGHQFRRANILRLASVKGVSSLLTSGQQKANSAMFLSSGGVGVGVGVGGQVAAADLRVHIEMFCANSVSEARVPLKRRPVGSSAPESVQVANCSDKNKQSWCVESDDELDQLRLKLFFLDLHSVPRNHIRYISWIAYVVRRDPKTGSPRESLAVNNAPHCNFYLQDGIDMGVIMDTQIPVNQLREQPESYLEANQLTVHIEWLDSLLLFSHLYNNYDSLATIQRHQISRELSALQQEFAHLEQKYLECRRAVELADFAKPTSSSPARRFSSQQPQHPVGTGRRWSRPERSSVSSAASEGLDWSLAAELAGRVHFRSDDIRTLERAELVRSQQALRKVAGPEELELADEEGENAVEGRESQQEDQGDQENGDGVEGDDDDDDEGEEEEDDDDDDDNDDDEDLDDRGRLVDGHRDDEMRPLSDIGNGHLDELGESSASQAASQQRDQLGSQSYRELAVHSPEIGTPDRLLMGVRQQSSRQMGRLSLGQLRQLQPLPAPLSLTNGRDHLAASTSVATMRNVTQLGERLSLAETVQARASGQLTDQPPWPSLSHIQHQPPYQVSYGELTSGSQLTRRRLPASPANYQLESSSTGSSNNNVDNFGLHQLSLLHQQQQQHHLNHHQLHHHHHHSQQQQHHQHHLLHQPALQRAQGRLPLAGFQTLAGQVSVEPEAASTYQSLLQGPNQHLTLSRTTLDEPSVSVAQFVDLPSNFRRPLDHYHSCPTASGLVNPTNVRRALGGPLVSEPPPISLPASTDAQQLASRSAELDFGARF